ncbi:UDP-N-acetylmuramoyl-L-alanine--D-glutamate ligase [Croceicoccus mobilis]|uniref:UDP-N-acetylmuramoyl-L-alanine--D-glutamate ligase n=1 Tax=Croceicoccus mobilis TaxID=1703339 RepID=UPI00082A9901|nr:UDP-N-acetylmuramoyl-L-alanine--D-glutamate ligase [Croceicoccus mobilis]
MSGAAAPILPPAIFAGRSYAVLGLARTGLAAIHALCGGGAKVLAWDRDSDARAHAQDLSKECRGRLTIAEITADAVRGFSGIVVSPGVPINHHPIADIAREANVPLIGDIELFAEARAALPAHKVAAITGTNGKSTTCALLHHLLAEAGYATRLGGNIGIPVLSTEPLEPNARGAGIYVFELSSYQIDITRSLSCEAAALLNVTPDHLDRYDGSFEAYTESKVRLFGMQQGRSLALVDRASLQLPAVSRALAHRSPIVIEDVSLPGNPDEWLSLQGPHNRGNAAAAVAIARRFGVEEAAIEAGLKSFRGLPHRMERVGEIGGAIFVNDSKATNPASTAPALAAFPPKDGKPRIHWIVGGLPKGEGLAECEEWLDHVACAYTIGEAGPMFSSLLEGRVPVVKSEMMGEAVRAAAEAATPGDVVLLSPACASFDQFRDYEKRGEAFRSLVAMLQPGESA